MASLMEGCQRVRESRRKAKKMKSFLIKEFKARGMINWNILWCLLVFVLPSVASGATSQTLHAQKGDKITFPCSLNSRENVSIRLTFGSRTIYGVKQHKDYKGRLHMSGTCDLTLQALKTTDAGKYVLSIFYGSDIISNTIHAISITDHLTGQKGRELELVDLHYDVDRVEHQNGSGWMEVWKRGQGVLNDHLRESNCCLVIKDFRSTDAGTYRVLTAADEVFITVIVTESTTGSNAKMNGTVVLSDTKRNLRVGIVAAVVLVVVVIGAVIMKYKLLNRNKQRDQMCRVL